MTAYWFRPKRYGYGATPVTWQGWVFTLGTALAIAAVLLCLPLLAARSLWAAAALIAFDAVVVAMLVIVTRRKTEGEWRWRWGDRA